jgi:hypothetical protein
MNTFRLNLFLLAAFVGLTVGLAPAFAAQRFVNSPTLLAHHYRQHVRRVQRLALAAYDDNRADFSLVTREEVESFIALHDRSKFEPKMLAKLYRVYGVGREPADPAVRVRLKQTVDELNGHDRAVILAFFRSRGMIEKDGTPSAKAQLLLALERIADRLDRNVDLVAREEFADETVQPISKFLAGRELEIARDLRARYTTLTKGFAFWDPICAADYAAVAH